MSAAPAPRTGRRPARARVDDPADELGVARAPDDVRPDDDHPHPVGVVGREREQLGGGLGPRVAAAGARRVRRSGAGTGERRAEVRDGRRRDVHEPRDARGARRRRAAVRVPPMFTSSYSATGPVIADLGGEVDHGLPVPHRSRDRGVGRSPSHARRSATPEALRCSVRTSCPSATSRAATPRPSMPLAPVTRTRVTGSPAPPPARFSAQAATRVRSTFELCRTSVGSRWRDEDRGDGGRRERRADVRRQPGIGDDGRRVQSVSTTTTTCCVPRGPTPTTAAARTPSTACARCSRPTGVTTPESVDDDVREPTLDPQQTVGVEVADVAGPVPAGVPGGGVLREPEAVVALLDVRRRDQHLARDPRLGARRAGRLAVGRRAR